MGESEKIEPILEDEQTVLTSSHAGMRRPSERFEEFAPLPAKRYNPALNYLTCEPPHRSMPVPCRKHGFPFDLASPRRRSCKISQEGNTTAQNRLAEAATILKEKLEQGDDEINEVAVKSLSPTTNSTGQAVSEVNEKTPLSFRFSRHQENRYSLPSELSSTEIDATPSKRRALHRQARMIDGALFHPRTRKGKFIESDTAGGTSPVKAVAEKLAKRLSVQSTQHANSPRTSWLQNVMARFRTDIGRKQQHPKLRKRHSSLADCGMTSPGQHHPPAACHGAVTGTAEMRQVLPPPTSVGFNGVSEYHNKPLPLSPAEEIRRSLASEAQCTFFAHASSFNPSLSKTSATSTPQQNGPAS